MDKSQLLFLILIFYFPCDNADMSNEKDNFRLKLMVLN